MEKEVIQKARIFEGTVPTDWELVGISENHVCRFRYYRDTAEQYWYTVQRMKRSYMQMAVREEEGLTYARNVYTGPRRKRRRMA